MNCSSRFRQLSGKRNAFTSQVQLGNKQNELFASLTCNRIQVELRARFIVTVDIQERRGLVPRVLPSFQHR